MKIKKYLPVIIGALILLVGFAFLAANENRNQSKTMTQLGSEKILFYGDTCPHCKTLDEYIIANNVEERIQFTRLEVFNNKANARVLAQAAQKCNLDSAAGMSVPFFYAGDECFLGVDEVIEYFER